MDITTENLPDDKVALTITLEEGALDKDIDDAFKELSKEVRIDGFRPGKVPRRVIEKRFGPLVARERALRNGLPRFYAQAVIAEKVDAIEPPDMEIVDGELEGPVTFKATVVVRPQIELSGYQDLKVEVPNPSVSEEDVDTQVDVVREQFAELETDDNPAIDGSVVQIDLTGTQDDRPIAGLNVTDFVYEVGSGRIVPELDEALRGANVGDILEFEDTLTELYGTREGEVAQFRVLVKAVNRRVLPDADDDWASEASEFDTLDELKGDIRRRLEAQRWAMADQAIRNGVFEQLASLVEVDAPDSLVQEDTQQRIQDLAQRLAQQGISLEQYVQIVEGGPEAFVAQVRQAAEGGVKADLALRAIVRQESLEASDDDVDEQLAIFTEQSGAEFDDLKSELTQNGAFERIRSDLERARALDYLLEQVEVVDEEGNTIDLDDRPDHLTHDHDHDHDGHDHGHDHESDHQPSAAAADDQESGEADTDSSDKTAAGDDVDGEEE
jgi:trigger factor